MTAASGGLRAKVTLREWVRALPEGLLRELGTHEELLDDDGAYAALWASWMS